MAEINAGVRVKTSDALKVPDKVTGLSYDPGKVPNPDTTSFRLHYDAATVPVGGTPVDGYKIFIDGAHIKTVDDGTKLDPGFGPPANTLVPGEDYEVTVLAYNSFGDGELSDPFIVTMATVSNPTPPAAPTGLALVSKTDTTVTLSWTAVTATPTPGYEVHVGGNVVATTGPGETQVEVTGLTASTAYTFTVVAINDNGSSDPSTGLAVTTNAPAGVATIMRTDDLLNYNGFNAKPSYGTGTYFQTTALNDLATSMGFRIYRQEPVIIVTSPSAAANRQLSFMRAMYAAWGTKFHATLGNMYNTPAGNVPAMTAEQLRVHAAKIVRQQLDTLVNFWKPDAGLANGGDLSLVVHSLAGPNEVENSKSGANWARNARIWQEAIWHGVREGKFWNGTDTTPGTGYVVTRAAFPAEFANVPIYGPSMRSDLDKTNADGSMPNATKPTTLAGAIIDQNTGDREISQWCDGGNVHLYQVAESPHKRLDTFIDLMRPTVKTPGYPTVPYIASETGYNTMGYGLDGADIATGANAGNSLDGAVKCPPWVQATFAVRAICNYAQKGLVYVRHEFLNDDDINANGAYIWDIQHWFGIVDTPSNDPATWTPMADYYAIRRMMNLLKDRADPKVPASHATTPLAFTVTTRNGCQILDTQKADGSHWLMIWRDIDFWRDNLDGTAGRVAYGSPEVAGLPPSVNCVIRLDHASGTKSVKRYQPNKAIWSGSGTTSTGHDDATDWSGANPTPDQDYGSIAAGGSFTVSVGVNLQIIKVA